MCFKVLDPEVSFRFIDIRPWAAHEHLFAVHRLLHVRGEFFQQVHEAAGDACVLRRHGDLLCFHHLFEKGVQELFPVLLTQGGWQDVELF